MSDWSEEANLLSLFLQRPKSRLCCICQATLPDKCGLEKQSKCKSNTSSNPQPSLLYYSRHGTFKCSSRRQFAREGFYGQGTFAIIGTSFKGANEERSRRAKSAIYSISQHVLAELAWLVSLGFWPSMSHGPHVQQQPIKVNTMRGASSHSSTLRSRI
jgi:hypothetical protein